MAKATSCTGKSKNDNQNCQQWTSVTKYRWIDSNRYRFYTHLWKPYPQNLKKTTQTSQKINALARLFPYMTFKKRKTIMKAFIESQFGYCTIVWILHCLVLNNKINSLHQKDLKITHRDKLSSFQNLLETN